MAAVWRIFLPSALDRLGRDLVHGVPVADLGGGLFRRFLVEDRSSGGAQPAARFRPESAEA